MRCEKCGGKLVMAGIRKARQRVRQRYLCKNCGKYTIAPGDYFAHKTHPARAIVSALTHYNLGHTLADTSKEINRRYKLKSSPTTVHAWIKEFRDVCSFSKIRAEVLKNNGPIEGQIRTKDFHHADLIYTMKLHRPKLLMKTVGFPGLRKYLFWLEDNSPDKYFEDGLKSSGLKTAFDVRIDRKFNAACRMTDLALKLARNNYERHERVEDFFLINDLSTVAVEVPVWYWDKKMGGVSGHIDILQIRGDKIHILDYKPDAHKGKAPIAQLSSYALALSFRTKTSLHDIRCAYFDENQYYEFSPEGLGRQGRVETLKKTIVSGVLQKLGV